MTRSSAARTPRVRLYDDRLELLLGATLLMTLQRGRSGANGKHGHVVDYLHVIHAQRHKPMAQLSSVYRDELFPRTAYRLMFDSLRQELPERAACKLMVALLSQAHVRAAHKATIITTQLPIDHGHGWIGDATVAVAILDRLMQRMQRINLTGESMRRPVVTKGRKQAGWRPSTG